MILSSAHRFALLAPWKTASSTAHLRLERYNDSPYSRFYDFNPWLQRVVHQHVTFAEFSMLPEGRAGYFTAAFVRNPYDRVYSGFLQLQRDISEQPHAGFPQPWIKALVMRQLAENFAQLAAAGFDFDAWLASVEEHQVYEVGRNSSFPLHPAHYWTGVGGVVQVDFVGRVERFEEDFRAFCARVGVAAPEAAANANISEVDTAAGEMRHAARMNAASISKINALFERDFELFGYRRL